MSIRLNRYISESGYCSRREADGYILSGVVTVNGVKGEYNTRVSPNDKVAIEGETIIPLRKIDFTTKEAPKSRKPVSQQNFVSDVKPDFITRPSKTERVAAGSKGAKPKTGKSDESKPKRPAKALKAAKPKSSSKGKKYVPKKKFNNI